MHRLVSLFAVCLFVSAASAQDWPQFRGRAADGVARGGGTFQDRSGVGLAVRWSQPLGSGYSGPAIADGRVFTQARDGEHDVMWAHEAKSGKTLWRFEIEPTYAGHDGSHDGPIATPVVIGERVFGLGARGRLFALDVESGKLLWSTSLPDDHGATPPSYGFCTSPIVAAGKLIVMIGAENAAVGAFDPATGEKLWTAGTATVHFQTPSLVRVGDSEVVLAAGSDKLVAVDVDSGEMLWDYEHGGSGGRGAASLTAVPTVDQRLFLAFRDDASTLVSWERGEDGPTFETVWEGRALRNSYNIAVYHEGHIYGFSSRFLTCIDEKTGESRWRSREPGDGFLMLADGHLVVATKAGTLHVVEATPEAYREVASVPLFDDLIWTPPAFADGSIFVRGLGGLARIDVTDGGSRFAEAEGEASLPADSAFRQFLGRVVAGESAFDPVDKLRDDERLDAYLELAQEAA